jgi:hypothetical protein
MEAAGRFSSAENPAPDDIDHLIAYFYPNMTRFTCQIILTPVEREYVNVTVFAACLWKSASTLAYGNFLFKKSQAASAVLVCLSLTPPERSADEDALLSVVSGPKGKATSFQNAAVAGKYQGAPS